MDEMKQEFEVCWTGEMDATAHRAAQRPAPPTVVPPRQVERLAATDKVLAALGKGPATQGQIRQRIGYDVSGTAVNDVLWNLVHQGLVERVGTAGRGFGRGQRYRVTAQGDRETKRN